MRQQRLQLALGPQKQLAQVANLHRRLDRAQQVFLLALAEDDDLFHPHRPPQAARLPAALDARFPGDEAVAAAAHGFDVLLVPARLQGAAQAADVGVDGALVEVDVAAPHLVEQLGAGVHALRMVHEEIQQPKFDPAQRHLAGAGGDALGAGVEPQAGHLHGIGGRMRRAPAQQGVHARDQFARAERLGDVIVGAGFERQDLVVLAARALDNMMIGRSRVRGWARRRRISATPDWPGKSHSSSSMSGSSFVEHHQRRFGIARSR